MRSFLFALFICSLLTTGCGDQKNDTVENGLSAPALQPQTNLDEAGTQKLISVLEDYYSLKDALVASNAAKADEAAHDLLNSTDSLKHHLASDAVTSIKIYLDTIASATKRLVSIKDESTEIKRIHFEKISDAMFDLLKTAEIKNAHVYRQYCPMAFNDKGAFWLSSEERIKNPYFGKKMLECGEVTDSLK